MSKSEANTNDCRKPEREVGGSGAGGGWLDVPGRGSSPKTLKEEERRRVCGAEIKLMWLELK